MRHPVHYGLAMLIGMACYGEAVGQAKRERPSIRQGNLKDGDMAPEFSLKDTEGKQEVKLADLKGKPVVLIFGSCTCPPFVSSTQETDKLFKKYQGKAHFYLVYIREAHPTDGRAIAGNQFQVKSPTSVAERQAVAKQFAERLKVSIPILVDTIDDQVETSYSCWPNRMYILDAQGKIVDKGLASPRGVASSAQRASTLLDKLLSSAP